MIYRRRCDLERTPIKGCMSGKGTVWAEKFPLGPEEMRREGRAYVRHTPNRGVSIDTHTHENEMETMAIVKEEALHTINGREQYLEGGDIIVAQPGDIHETSQAGEESLVLIVRVLFAQMAGHKKL